MGRRAARLIAAAIVLMTVAVTASESAHGATASSMTSPLCRPLPAAAPVVPFAPYVDVTLHGVPTIDAVACGARIREFTLAFFTAVGSACEPSLAGQSYANGFLAIDVVRLRTLGGSVIGSFGGAVGHELALVCPTASALAAAYQKVIDFYQLTSVDFDVEGAAALNGTANSHRDEAIKILESRAAASHRQLAVSMTLSVEPQGLPAAELKILRGAIAAHAVVSVVNIMTMDFGDGSAPNPSGRMGTYTIEAAAATQRQLEVLYPRLTAAQVASKIGIVPMIGQNDETDEIFSLANATAVAGWAARHRIGRLSFWSVDRDRQCAGGIDHAASGLCSGVIQPTWAYAKAMEVA